MQAIPDDHWPLPTTELKPALDLALALTRADMGVLMLHDETADAMLPALGAGMSDEDCDAIGAHRSGVGPFGQACAERHRVVIRDVVQDAPSLAELAKRLEFRAIEIQPLITSSGQAVGALGRDARLAGDPVTRASAPPLRIAMLGMVDGNGHPYSWSAIINGRFDRAKMEACGFPVIPEYLGAQPPSTAGNYVSQIGTLVYFGFFLLMPWWSRIGTFKPVPERVTFKSH